MCPSVFRYIKMTKMSTHACRRFWEYAQEIPEIANKNWTVRKLRKLVAQKIQKEIKSGLVVDSTGAFHIPIGWGLYAAITLPANGYLVVTVHKNERDIDLEKLETGINKKIPTGAKGGVFLYKWS